MLDTYGRKYLEPIINSTANNLLKMNLSANQVTGIAFFIGVLAGPLVYVDQIWLALVFLWISGFLDAVDGAMARLTKTSEWGTVLDITFDRLVEISAILGLALRFPNAILALLFLSVAIIVSMTVFLTVGAVSEKKGMKSFYYQAGLAERTEGFIFFSVMIIFDKYLIIIASLFAFIVAFTAVQRLLEAKKILN